MPKRHKTPGERSHSTEKFPNLNLMLTAMSELRTYMKTYDGSDAEHQDLLHLAHVFKIPGTYFSRMGDEETYGYNHHSDALF